MMHCLSNSLNLYEKSSLYQIRVFLWWTIMVKSDYFQFWVATKLGVVWHEYKN